MARYTDLMTHMDLIGTVEVARHLGKSVSQVNRMANQGLLKPIGRLGKRGINVFSVADIEAYAASLKKEGATNGAN